MNIDTSSSPNIYSRKLIKVFQFSQGKLLTEQEWRALGVQQSRGWVHYEIHRPEPHILLFRRPLGTDANTGLPPQGWSAPY